VAMRLIKPFRLLSARPFPMLISVCLISPVCAQAKALGNMAAAASDGMALIAFARPAA
jgi:hypothetical protein